MSAKLDFVQAKSAATPAEQLRACLTTLERQGPALRRANREALLAYLTNMDAAAGLLTQLRQAGADVTPEALRLETVVRQLQSKAGPLLAKLGGADGLAAARPPDAELETHPWWFLDETVARRRAAGRKRATIIGGVIVALVAVAAILLNTVFKPDPLVLEKVQRFENAVELVVEAQDDAAALAEVDAILQIAPDDIDTLAFKTILLEQLGRPAEAGAIIAEASRLETPAAVHLARGQVYWQIERPEGALSEARQVVELDPDSAEGWFLAGQSHAALGETDAAREALSKAAELALAQGNDSLYVIAKTNLTYLSPAGGNGN